VFRFALDQPRSVAMQSKREHWTKRLEAWSRSGQTRVAFCRSQRLNLSTFDYWRRMLRDALPSTALVPVVVSASTVSSIEIVLPNGIRLQVAGADAAQVRALVLALQPC
jgi:hypothetical protein